jgi:hypothetical protein
VYLNRILSRGMQLRNGTGFPDMKIILKYVIIAIHRQSSIDLMHPSAAKC